MCFVFKFKLFPKGLLVHAHINMRNTCFAGGVYTSWEPVMLMKLDVMSDPPNHWPRFTTFRTRDEDQRHDGVLNLNLAALLREVRGGGGSKR